jgi:hypothetical protein
LLVVSVYPYGDVFGGYLTVSTYNMVIYTTLISHDARSHEYKTLYGVNEGLTVIRMHVIWGPK